MVLRKGAALAVQKRSEGTMALAAEGKQTASEDSTENVFDLIEEAGRPFDRLILHFHRLAELLEERRCSREILLGTITRIFT